jgi:Mor family transcriptional regulator
MKNKTGRPFKEKRNVEITKRWLRGWTLKALSAEYGLTYGRISQIVRETHERGLVSYPQNRVARF